MRHAPQRITAALEWRFPLVIAAVLITQAIYFREAAAAEPATSASRAVALKDDPGPPDFLDRVEGVFAGAVNLLDRVLFHRIGRTTRHSILYEPSVLYIRDRGTSDSFELLGTADADTPQRLSDADVELLAAEERLAPGQEIQGESRPYRHSLLGRRPVESLRVKLAPALAGMVEYGDRLVRERRSDGGVQYRKLSAKRDLPTDVVASEETVQQWAERGALRLADSPLAGEPAYLMEEVVGGAPLVVCWLAFGALYFTLYMRFFNFRGFWHAVNVIRGKYDDPSDPGEVSHAQALSLALSGTIGLGNIAGVTIAMTIGGPGAFFWMLMSGLLGMSTKFVECTLGVKYRLVNPDGTVLGGPMRYLQEGFTEIGLRPVGVTLAVAFTLICMFASLGGGNMLQANQAGSAALQMFQEGRQARMGELNAGIAAAAAEKDAERMRSLQTERSLLTAEARRFEKRFKIGYGFLLATLVAIVILGGVKRVAAAAEKIVPSMCLIYMAACAYIILQHLPDIPGLVVRIFTEAFTGAALGGGALGAFVIGIQRAAFSNEAGNGTAAIAHAAARTDEPIREGCVALLEPFIDTIIVCSMTALVILITGAWDHDEWVVQQQLQGAALTSRAFQAHISWFPIVLSIAVTLFAYSTIISNAYYGERSWAYLLGDRSVIFYKLLTVSCTFIGVIVSLSSVIDFSDMMTLGMAFPNILGLMLLAPKVRSDLADYWRRYQAGEFPTFPRAR